MAKTFVDFAQEVIKVENRPLSARQIWECGVKRGLDKPLESEGKTQWITIASRINSNIRELKEQSPFRKLGTTRKTFYLASLMANLNQVQVQELEKRIDSADEEMYDVGNYDEKDLHAFLAYYARYHLKAYTKTIKHNRSEKKAFAEWMHPDMVGVSFPFDEWGSEVTDFGKEIGNISVRLFSFELKKELNQSTLRESFFQAVSNSSWANLGYLVAPVISDDEDFEEELSRLSSSFGIGIIHIDLEDPDASEVRYPCKEKVELDWKSMNKLSELNSDFREFLKRIKNDIMTSDPRSDAYDTILEAKELTESLGKKPGKEKTGSPESAGGNQEKTKK